MHSSWSRNTGPKLLPRYQGVFTGYATKFKWEKENFRGRSISARVITQSTSLKEHFLSLFSLSLLCVCHCRVVSVSSRSQVVFGIRVFISNFTYVVLGVYNVVSYLLFSFKVVPNFCTFLLFSFFKMLWCYVFPWFVYFRFRKKKKCLCTCCPNYARSDSCTTWYVGNLLLGSI